MEIRQLYITSLLILFSLLLLACGQENKPKAGLSKTAKSDTTVIHIPLELASDVTYSLSDLVQITRVVRLESHAETILGDASAVYQLPNGHWLTADKRSAQIKVFDSTGRFMYPIGAVGKGPGEWLSLNVVDYDSVTGRLMTLSNQDMRVNLYQTDGPWVRDMLLPFAAQHLIMLPDNQWAALTGFNVSDISGNFHLLLADKQMEISNRYLGFGPKKKNSMRGVGFLRRTTDGCLIQVPFGDTIFHWQPGTLTPRYAMDFGDRAIPKDRRGDLSYMMGNPDFIDMARQMGQAWETDRYLVFGTTWDRRHRVRVWDRQQQRLWGYEQCDAPLAARNLFRPVGITPKGEWIVPLLPTQVHPEWNKPGSYTAEAATQTRAYLQAHYPEVFAQLADWQEDDNYALLCVRFALPSAPAD